MVGGYAVGFHGYPRGTGDLDVWISTDPDNAPKVAAALKDFGFEVPSSPSRLFDRHGRMFRMGVPPLRIELLTAISGVTFEECKRDVAVMTVDGIEINVISLDHLKRNKRASGRSRDLNDLENLP